MDKFYLNRRSPEVPGPNPLNLSLKPIVSLCLAFGLLVFLSPAPLEAAVRDLDRDGRPNSSDSDIDNDGIPNRRDRNVDGGRCKSGRLRGRYIGDRLNNDSPAELDIDADGLLDTDDAETDIDGDRLSDDSGSEDDIDGDGRPDDSSRETDIDGDGLADDSPVAAMAWVQANGDAKARAGLLRQIRQWWEASDPEAASRWLRAHPAEARHLTP